MAPLLKIELRLFQILFLTSLLLLCKKYVYRNLFLENSDVNKDILVQGFLSKLNVRNCD